MLAVENRHHIWHRPDFFGESVEFEIRDQPIDVRRLHIWKQIARLVEPHFYFYRWRSGRFANHRLFSHF
jgi:hypothetical protein